jgi:hypothetical protein
LSCHGFPLNIVTEDLKCSDNGKGQHSTARRRIK